MQTFEIYMPAEILEKYRLNYMQKIETAIHQVNSLNEQRFNAVEKAMMEHRRPAIPKGLELDDLMI